MVKNRLLMVLLAINWTCLMEVVWMKQHTHASKLHFVDNFVAKLKQFSKKYLIDDVDLEKIEFLNRVSTQSFLSTAIISLIPFLLLGFLPKSSCYTGSKLMRFLLGFAVGSLLGDTLLHLVPHAIGSNHSKHSDHSELSDEFINIAYPLLGGLLIFYIIESLIHIVKYRMQQRDVGLQKKKDIEPSPSKISEQGTSPKKSKNKQTTPSKVTLAKPNSVDSNDIPPESTSKKRKSKNISQLSNYNPALSTAAILNFVTDFSHNLLDGMAISAAYQKDFRLGLATTIGVLIHEIPHEISDFAILIKVGYSKWKAAFIQLITATGAILGTYLGLYLSQRGIHNEYPQWVLPFIAGGFIYISCVCVVPGMLNEPNPKILKLVIEVAGMVCGVSLMEIFNSLHLH